MRDYKILQAPDTVTLREAVLRYIDYGYVVAGGVSACCESGRPPEYLQAVWIVRLDELKT